MAEKTSATGLHIHKSDVGRYAFSVLLVGIAALVRWSCAHVLEGTPYLAFYPAVAVAAAVGGFGPGVTATILSLFFVDLLFDSSYLKLGFESPTWTARQFIFLVGGLGVSLIARSLRTTRVRERRQAEALSRQNERLQESEQRLRANFQNAALGIIEVDAEDRAVEVNERFCQILGYRREELLGRSVHELTFPEDQKTSDELNAELHDGVRARLDYEKRYLRSDGSPVWVHVTVSSIRDAAGRLLRCLGTVEDISERKHAEEALRRSEHEKGLILDSTNEIIAYHDLDQNLIWANRAYLKATDLERRQLEGRKCYSCWGLDALCYQCPVTRAIQTGEPQSAELTPENQGWPPDYKSWFVRAAPVRDSTGKVIGAIELAHDITDRKRAEEALRQSEARFRTMADAIPQLAWIAKPDGWIYWYNRRWHDYTGTTPEQMEGWGWQSVHDPQTLPAVIERWKSSIATGRPFDMVFPLRGGDGVFRPFLTRVMPLKDDEGRVVQWFGTNTDITEQKRVEAELTAAKASAEEANHVKDRFLAVMSHELRTPLTPVLAAVSILQKDPGPNQAVLEMIRRNVELEAGLIDDLLDLTSIARGRIELNRRTVELRSVVERAIEVCRPDIEARQVNFGVNCAPGSYPVEADTGRLQQVFWNLLRNAVKFTPHGGCIGVRCRGEGNQAVVEVTDSGIGIEPEALGRVFNAFAQADPAMTRHFGGAGMGLAISKTIIELHGGTIEAMSDGKGKGAAFRVRLPLASPATAQPSAGSSQESETREAESRTRRRKLLRLLVVEDHGDTLEMLRRMLESHGYKVTTAGDVATALEAAQKGTFDMLISDLGLPDGTGLDLIRELRKRGRKLPGIAVSGYGQDVDLRLSREAGFAAHVIKPVDVDRLLSVMADVEGRVAV